MTLALMEIRPVYSRGGHLDQDFPFSRPGHLSFIDRQHFRSTKSRQLDHSHASSIAAGEHVSRCELRDALPDGVWMQTGSTGH
jgi:hypothetical protein